MILRAARPEDAAHFVRIKDALPMRRADGTAVRGGFLLGTDEATYRRYISESYCTVAEGPDGVVGFGIVFPDAQVKASELWQKRHSATWAISPEPYDSRNIAYFEQLAFLPGHRRTVVQLAYRMVRDAFRAGADAMFTTTVREPVLNLAAVPFILSGGGQKAGIIDEHYPTVGRIQSDIYCLEREAFFRHLIHSDTHPLLLAALHQKNADHHDLHDRS